MSETIEIIGVPQSNFVRTVRIVAEERRIPYEVVAARPHTPEVLAISPLGKIPVMRHGDVELCESRAIIAYLDATFPGARITPANIEIAVRIEQFVSMFTTTMAPVFGPQYLRGYFFPGTPDGSADRTLIDAAVPKLESFLAICDEAVARGGFAGGELFSIADAYLYPMLDYLVGLPESGAIIANLPALKGYHQRLAERESIKATTPPPLPRN